MHSRPDPHINDRKITIGKLTKQYTDIQYHIDTIERINEKQFDTKIHQPDWSIEQIKIRYTDEIKNIYIIRTESTIEMPKVYRYDNFIDFIFEGEIKFTWLIVQFGLYNLYNWFKF